MPQPVYIAIDDEGFLTLFVGDGTEPKKVPIVRGPFVRGGRPLRDEIDALCSWAREQGYEVITPAYDLVAPPIPLEPTPDDLDRLDLDEIDALLDDLDDAG